MSTKIQWTDVTDNIIVVADGGWWCRKISPGCANCYAAALNQSDFFGGNKLPYSGAVPKLRLREDAIDGWARQTKPKRHFVASMTDVFGEWVPQQWISRFLDGMARAPKQTFQILTKRAAWMETAVQHWLWWTDRTEVPQNIWLGVSVENQKCADERIPILLRIPARVRFLSVEPMLERIDLTYPKSLFPDGPHMCCDGRECGCWGQPVDPPLIWGIRWCVVGGESGPNARPCNIEWIRSIVRQCRDCGVKMFVKQLGTNSVQDLSAVIPEPDITDPDLEPADIAAWEHHRYNAPRHFKHPKGGDMAEFPDDLKVREFPDA